MLTTRSAGPLQFCAASSDLQYGTLRLHTNFTFRSASERDVETTRFPGCAHALMLELAEDGDAGRER